MSDFELEISASGFIDFVCAASAKSAPYFQGHTKAGMRVRLHFSEMPFAETTLSKVQEHTASNCGKLYSITAEQAADLHNTLSEKIASLENWSADYIAQGGPVAMKVAGL